jgi:Tol biopolymer transport system component
MQCRAYLRLLVAIIWFVIAGCDLRTPNAVPTLIDLNATVTAQVGTSTALAKAVEAATATGIAFETRRAPTALPPTWTPSPVPTQSAEVAASLLTAVPSGGRGTIYFVFSGEAIAALSIDHDSEQIIMVGGAPSDLKLAPDSQHLAYVALSPNGNREVFISRLDGTGVQQVSCLNFARIASPTWSPDSQRIAFAASATPDDPFGIYVAGIQNASQCPFGNNQKLLTQSQSDWIDSLAWSNDGSRLFFAADAVYGIHVASVTLYPPLTQPTGFGPDFSLAFQPGSQSLFYLKTERDDKTGATGGILSQVSTADLTTLPLSELRTTLLYAASIQWSWDGRYLLSATTEDVLVQDMKAGTANSIVLKSKFPPQPVFSPGGALVAYVDAGAGPDNIPQIFLVGRDGTNRNQVTFHKGGTISDLNWVVNG